MTCNPKRILLLLLAAAMMLSSSGCSLRLSTEEEAAEESRQEEEANRPPETEPPETVPLNPPPPIIGWNDGSGKGDEGEQDETASGGEDVKSGEETEAADVVTIRAPYYTSALYEAGGKYWSYSEGKFTYTLPARDESGILPVEEM